MKWGRGRRRIGSARGAGTMADSSAESSPAPKPGRPTQDSSAWAPHKRGCRAKETHWRCRSFTLGKDKQTLPVVLMAAGSRSLQLQ